MRTILVVAVAAVVLGACYRDNDPNLPPSDVVFASSAAPDAESPCSRACARLASLHCPEAEPTRYGRTCTSVCERNADLLPAACVNAACDVDGVRACGVRCVP